MTSLSLFQPNRNSSTFGQFFNFFPVNFGIKIIAMKLPFLWYYLQYYWSHISVSKWSLKFILVLKSSSLVYWLKSHLWQLSFSFSQILIKTVLNVQKSRLSYIKIFFLPLLSLEILSTWSPPIRRRRHHPLPMYQQRRQRQTLSSSASPTTVQAIMTSSSSGVFTRDCEKSRENRSRSRTARLRRLPRRKSRPWTRRWLDTASRPTRGYPRRTRGST